MEQGTPSQANRGPKNPGRSGRPDAYFGKDLKAAPRSWSLAEIEENFNPDCVNAAFDTVEIAINPVELGKTIRAHIVSHPRIESSLSRTVTKAKIEDNAVWVETESNNEVRKRSQKLFPVFGRLIRWLFWMPMSKGALSWLWGKTDIYDPASEVHQRHDIGIQSVGRFHSVDPGKLTMAAFLPTNWPHNCTVQPK